MLASFTEQTKQFAIFHYLTIKEGYGTPLTLTLTLTLAWTIPWMEEPGRLQSMRSLKVRHDWATSLSRIGEGNGNPLQCSCLENPRDGEPGGLPSMGPHRVGHYWSDLAAAAYHIYLSSSNWDFCDTWTSSMFCKDLWIQRPFMKIKCAPERTVVVLAKVMQ